MSELNSFHKPMIAVYDRKTGFFDRPFAVRHIGEAIREWDIVRKDQNTKIGKNPEDFLLQQLGHFDELTGELIPQKPFILAAGV